MKLIYAFLNATAFAYLTAALYAFLGKPALDHINDSQQGVIYCLLFGAIHLSMNIKISLIYFILGIFYSIATVSSFIGWPQKWMAHWKKEPKEGSDPSQIGMALWDLALSISFFYLASI